MHTTGLIASASLFLPAILHAETWTVDDSGKADFTTIQGAVDAASSGDEIVVLPGTYHGEGDSVVNMLGKAIHLRSASGPEVTVIQGDGFRRGVVCNTDETPETVIDGFTFTKCFSHAGAAVRCYFSSPTITNCIMTGNRASWIGGAIHVYESDAVITNCLMSGNDADMGGGIYCQKWSYPIISGCTIANHHVQNTGGGIRTNQSWPFISDSHFCDNDPHHISGNWNDDGGNTFANECELPCPADFDGNEHVNIMDLLSVIDAWGTCEGCEEDLTGPDGYPDGTVGIYDLLAVIAQWGGCP